MYKHNVIRQHHHLVTSELKKLTWNVSLGTIAGSLVGIFIPIYLYILGYSLASVFAYFTAMGAVAVFGHLLGAYLLRWIGGNRLIVLADLSDVIALAMLATLPQLHWPIFLIALFKGVGKGLYWPAFHASFSQHRDRNRASRQISAVSVLLILAGSVAPAIGGVVATQYGLGIVYGLGIAAMVASAVPLLVGKDESKGYKADFSKLSIKQVLPDYVAGFCYTAASIVQMIVWPLVIYFIVKTYAGVGLLSTVITLSSIAVTIHIGKKAQSSRQKNYLNKGSFLSAATSGIRLIAATPPLIFIVNFFSGITDAILYTPFVARYYSHADSVRRVEYVTGMEVAHSLTWTVYPGILALLSLVLPLESVLIIGLVMAMPAALGVRAMR